MLTGVILAGGQNRRMDRKIKALLPFHGETILQRQIRTMKKICSECIVVTHHMRLFQSILKDDNVQMVSDRIPGKGPLSGMHASFSMAKNEPIWVVACDMPFICERTAEFLRQQLLNNQMEAAVPVIDGNLQPLHAVYKKSLLPQIHHFIVNDHYKLIAFVKSMHWMPITKQQLLQQSIDTKFTTNVNTISEYECAIKGR